MNQGATIEAVREHDHMPALIGYIERCIDTHGKWSLDAAEGVIRQVVDKVERSKIKLLAAGWLQQQSQAVDSNSVRASELRRIKAEMETEAMVRRRRVGTTAKTASHVDARRYAGVNNFAAVHNLGGQTIGVNYGAMAPPWSGFVWEPTRWPSPTSADQEQSPDDGQPRPSPARARKQRETPLDILLAYNVPFDFQNGQCLVDATPENVKTLCYLGLPFFTQEGRLVVHTDEDKGAIPKAKRPRTMSGANADIYNSHAVFNKGPPAEPSYPLAAEAPSLVTGLPARLFNFPKPQNQPPVQERLASPTVQAASEGAAANRTDPVPGGELGGLFLFGTTNPSKEETEQAQQARSKAAENQGVNLAAGDDVSSGVAELSVYGEEQRRQDWPLFDEAAKVPVNGLTTGRATPPQGVEPHGAVLLVQNVTMGDKAHFAGQSESNAASEKDKATETEARAKVAETSSLKFAAGSDISTKEQLRRDPLHPDSAKVPNELTVGCAAASQGVELRGAATNTEALAKAADVAGLKFAAGGDLSSKAAEPIGGNEKLLHDPLLLDPAKAPTNELTSGSAPPPQGVEPHGAVLSVQNVATGNTHLAGPDEVNPNGAKNDAAETGADVSSGVTERDDSSGGKEHGRAGSEDAPKDLIKDSPPEPQGVESAGLLLFSQGDTRDTERQQATSRKGGAAENATDEAEADADVRTSPGESSGQNQSEHRKGAGNPVADEADAAEEEQAPALTAQQLLPFVPEPEEEDAPPTGPNAAKERLELATEILAMETVDLLDSLSELSCGVLKPEAKLLTMLETERQTGTLPEDGGSLLGSIVALYKARTGNPEGKAVHQNIIDWETARNEALEAKFSLLKTGEEAEEEGPGKRHEEDETWTMAGSGRLLDVRGAGLHLTGGADGKRTGGEVERDTLAGYEDEGDAQKENETEHELSRGVNVAIQRGVLTENGQEGVPSVRAGEKQKGAGQPRAVRAVSSGTKNADGGPRSQVAQGQIALGETAQSAPGMSRIPMAPHLRAQPRADFDYVTERGRGSAIVDPPMQVLTRSRSVSPGRPPRYGERRLTQSTSSALPANPGYLQSTGLLHEAQAPAQGPTRGQCITAVQPTASTEDLTNLNDWVQTATGCAFTIPAGAPTTHNADKAAMTAKAVGKNTPPPTSQDIDAGHLTTGAPSCNASAAPSNTPQFLQDEGMAAALGLLKMREVTDGSWEVDDDQEIWLSGDKPTAADASASPASDPNSLDLDGVAERWLGM